jgi:predicted TPR repeat methyltransferase
MSKKYDQAYFDRWYRDPAHRVITAAALRRKVTMVSGVAEHVLRREIRSVLDIGCGEALWRAELRRLRPRVSYLGLDASEYVVGRYGHSRNIRQAAFADARKVVGGARYDLIVCSDVLHYISEPELGEGLGTIADALAGIAFLEVLTKEDDPDGDLTGFHVRSASFYRRIFEQAGLRSVGLHCYVGPGLGDSLSALE